MNPFLNFLTDNGRWATSVLGFISICLIPIPYLFYVYGAAIRKRGKYTASLT